jgi:hypothetical protein
MTKVGFCKLEKADVLWGDGRMESRFALFEKVCLPSLLQQSLTVVLLTSDAMPERFHNRLMQIINDYPQRKAKIVVRRLDQASANK